MRPQARRTRAESKIFAQFTAHGPYSTELDRPGAAERRHGSQT